MTNYRIVYPNDIGGIAIIVPAEGMQQSDVLKAVPSGQPYLIMDVSDIPTDGAFRDAWEADFTDAPIKE